MGRPHHQHIYNSAVAAGFLVACSCGFKSLVDDPHEPLLGKDFIAYPTYEEALRAYVDHLPDVWSNDDAS